MALLQGVLEYGRAMKEYSKKNSRVEANVAYEIGFL